MLAETILGSALGGILRLAPEFMKAWDRKNERQHELKMQDKALEFEKLRGAQRMEELRHEGQQVLDSGGLQALVEAIRGQSRPTGVGWADALSATVRPILTYWWCVGLVTAAMVCQFILYVEAGVSGPEAVTMLWGPEEKTIVAGMLNFWFLDRVIRKNTGV